MPARKKTVMREGRHLLHRLRQGLRRRSLVAGLILALSRFFFLLGVVFLTLWSYSVWGSQTSPLAMLFWPAVFLFVAGAGCQLFFSWYSKVLHRAERVERRRKRIG